MKIKPISNQSGVPTDDYFLLNSDNYLFLKELYQLINDGFIPEFDMDITINDLNNIHSALIDGNNCILLYTAEEYYGYKNSHKTVVEKQLTSNIHEPKMNIVKTIEIQPEWAIKLDLRKSYDSYIDLATMLDSRSGIELLSKSFDLSNEKDAMSAINWYLSDYSTSLNEVLK